MRVIAHVRKELETLPTSSAWDKGVRDFAVDMFEPPVEDSKRISAATIGVLRSVTRLSSASTSQRNIWAAYGGSTDSL